jgi:hypothetical protein
VKEAIDAFQKKRSATFADMAPLKSFND